MKVQTVLKPSQYEDFKQKAKQLGVSEYELAREGVLIVTYQPRQAIDEKKFIAKLLELFESGQNIP